jgi:hypothetical protein
MVGTLAEVFENGALRKILGPKPKEITDNKRKLHNDVLHELEKHYRQILSGNHMKSGEMGEACSK